MYHLNMSCLNEHISKLKKELSAKNILKCLIEGFAIGIVAYALPNKRKDWREIMAVSVLAAMTLFILDIFVDDAHKGALFGVGFGTGMNLVNMTGPLRIPLL